MFLSMFICMYVCMYACICKYVCMYLLGYVCMYVYTKMNNTQHKRYTSNIYIYIACIPFMLCYSIMPRDSQIKALQCYTNCNTSLS